MKIFFLLIFFSLCYWQTFAQERSFTIRVSGEWVRGSLEKDVMRSTGIQINGKSVLWDSVGIIIKTHYPDFDTIHYFDTDFVSRFKPGEKYMMVGSCCAMLDILPEKEAELFMSEEKKLGEDWNEGNFDSLRSLYYDQPVAIRFSNKHKKYFKNQCAYSPDMAMFPFLVLLEKVTDTNWYYVPKGWYRSNFTTLAFLEVSDSLLIELQKQDLDESEEVVEAFYIENIPFDASCRYRFFHREKLEIEYDPRKKKITRLRIMD